MIFVHRLHQSIVENQKRPQENDQNKWTETVIPTHEKKNQCFFLNYFLDTSNKKYEKKIK